MIIAHVKQMKKTMFIESACVKLKYIKMVIEGQTMR